MSDDKRTINKQEAIRHLLHAAIRLIMKAEDPFAIHLLVHSADKLLIDVSKKTGQELKVDWELYIKDEHHKDFFEKHRELYNYFKHADQDFNIELPIQNIAIQNIMNLFISVVNYVSLFKQNTNHMILFQWFIMALRPNFLKQDIPQGSELVKLMHNIENLTPEEYFEIYWENAQGLLPIAGEKAKDLEDIKDFYRLTFAELRAGKTKSSRVFRIREY
jgi:hypothetical protein